MQAHPQGVAQLGLRVRVGRDRRRRIAPAACARAAGSLEGGRAAFGDQVDQPPGPIALRHVEHPPAIARAGNVDDQVRPHAGADQQRLVFAERARRRQRLAVERDQPGRQALEAQAEDPGVGGIDQAQPQALAGPHGLTVGQPPVDRDRVADAAGVGHVAEIEKVLDDPRLPVQAPVVEQPDELAIHRRRVRFVHDQHPVQAAVDLLRRRQVRVVPVGAGIGRREPVVEALAGRHRPLGQPRHAVHRIGQADAVPMDRGGLGQGVVERGGQHAALRQPEQRPGYRALVVPDGGRRGEIADQCRPPCGGVQPGRANGRLAPVGRACAAPQQRSEGATGQAQARREQPPAQRIRVTRVVNLEVRISGIRTPRIRPTGFGVCTAHGRQG